MDSIPVTFTQEKETLLIPLYAKAWESRFRDSVLADAGADTAIRRIDCDFGRLNVTRDMMVVLALRARVLEGRVRAFVAAHPAGCVLNVGCGLDTRAFRVAPPKCVCCYDYYRRRRGAVKRAPGMGGDAAMTVRRFSLGVALALACLVATLAMPVRLWRTGRMTVPPLALSGGGRFGVPDRIWIDTDAACGHTARTDVDDCLALWLLAKRSVPEVVAVSTVFGNAPLDVVDRTTGDLVRLIGRTRSVPVTLYGGSPEPTSTAAVTAARRGLTRALETGRLTIVALGPLTNVADVLTARPDLGRNVERVVAVMGRRVGHLFHPSEGSGRGSLLGHGPVFRDFNFAADPDAVRELIRMDVPLTLIPYDAATRVEITREDLRRLALQDDAGAWIASRSQGWLEYWRRDIGRTGFYPFDLMAAAYVIGPSTFRCADVDASVGSDPALFIPLFRPEALLVEPREANRKGRVVAYCPAVEGGFERALRSWMFGGGHGDERPPAILTRSRADTAKDVAKLHP